MKLSEKILYSRKRAGLSQEALADMVGVSRQAVSKWETGEALPETAKLPALGTALGVSLDWLLSDAEPEEPEEELPVEPDVPLPVEAPVELPPVVPLLCTAVLLVVPVSWLSASR